MIYPQEKAIHFEKGLSWREIQAKAKVEKKYIFLYCYATGCEPCESMEKEVYSNGKIGDYMNVKFISAKVQMDTTDLDDSSIINWYSDSHKMREQYRLSYSLPAYLFFSPEGRIVHRGQGVIPDSAFIKLSANALDSTRQYYTLLENYKIGRINVLSLPYLIRKTVSIGDHELATKIANYYKDNFLDKFADSALYTRENIELISEFPMLIRSGDRFFNLFYLKAEMVDKIMNRNAFAENYVKFIITRDEITNKLWNNDKPIKEKPNWSKMRSSIRRKYNTYYAQRLILDAQLNFYTRIGNWKYVARAEDRKIREIPPGEGAEGRDYAWDLNTAAWTIFLKCNYKTVLAKALVWSDLSIKLDSTNDQAYDTKANLLYEIGRVTEAIAFEEKAIELTVLRAKQKMQQTIPLYNEYNETLSKMRARIPTWTHS